MVVITIQDICQWSGSTPSHRNFREGERLVAAKHLLNCGIVKEDSDVFEISASCIQTSNVRGSPHEIHGILGKNGEVKSITCSCKAGLGEKCKHIMAALLFCSRNEISVLSCTDIKCQWKQKYKDTLQNYVARPLEEHECLKSTNNNNPLSEDVEMAIKSILLQNLPNSAFSKHVSGRHNPVILKSVEDNAGGTSIGETLDEAIEVLFALQRSEFMDAIKNVSVTVKRSCCEETIQKMKDDFATICKRSKESYSEWQKQRRYRVTGSRCYALYATRRTNADWNKKCDQYFNPKSFASMYTEYGKKTESEALEVFKTTFNLTIIQVGLVISSQNPWLAYSPDGIIYEKNVPTKLVEIKCPFKGKSKTVMEAIQFEFKKGLAIENENISLKEKHAHYAQIQLGMAVLNLKSAFFVIYASFDKSILVIDVPFNEMYTFNMLSVLKKTYYDKMVHFICPNDENSNKER
ncbi:uncharacterized protein [Neodiprion pinetum]|uniref:uncharacterized protein n=2 Tax=Neodiprion TaxID=270857 RepID=UPI001EDDF3F3|nr:uncharacterized protein LOC124214689 [Neodiprion pinetum]